MKRNTFPRSHNHLVFKLEHTEVGYSSVLFGLLREKAKEGSVDVLLERCLCRMLENSEDWKEREKKSKKLGQFVHVMEDGIMNNPLGDIFTRNMIVA